jgi:hypothetical protein
MWEHAPLLAFMSDEKRNLCESQPARLCGQLLVCATACLECTFNSSVTVVRKNVVIHEFRLLNAWKKG